MKLTIFGGTGKTGICLVKKALRAGHEVAAFSHSHEKIAFSHDRLSIYEGDALDPNAVTGAINSSDAIISLQSVGLNSWIATLESPPLCSYGRSSR